MIFFKDIISKILKNNLILNAGYYTIFRVIDKIIPFLLLPIVTRQLTVDEFGIFVLFQAIASIILPVSTLCIDSSILLNYYKINIDKFKIYFSSGYILLIICFMIISCFIWLIRKNISELSTFPVDWIMIIVLFCFFQFHSNLALNLFQIKKEVFKFGLYSVSLTFIKNTLMLIFVIVFDMKWEGIIIGYLLAYLIYFIISLIIFKYNQLYTTEIQKNYIIDNIKVGFPLSLHNIGAWLGSSASRIIIGSLIGSSALGSFGAGASIALIVLYIQDSFNKAFVPYLFEKLNDFNHSVSTNLVKLTYIYYVFILITAVFIGTIGYLFIDVIFGVDYIDGRDIVFYISIGYAFDGMYKMHVNYLFYEKKTHIIFIITMLTGIINLPITYYLIQLKGLTGAGISFLIVNIFAYLLSWFLSQKVFPMNWFILKRIDSNEHLNKV